MSNLQKRKEGGFTIIEVLIVLAIAGLIMLIVFLAVPALQRNSRNTQRKADVSSLIGAIQEWENNNSGAVPTSAAEQTAAASNAKLGYYATTDVSWAAGSSAVIGNDKMKVVTGAKCGTAGVAAAGSSRQIAVLYQYETSSGLQNTCQDS